MFDFEEELKKFKPGTDADLDAMEFTGDETTDMQTIVKMILQSENSRKGRKVFEQLGLEEFQ